jgi:hypothetical protein
MASYRQTVEAAVTEFDAGRWAEARALFLRAHELWPSARTFRALGMTSFELRDYARTVSELEQALSDPRRTLDDEQKTQTKALLDRAKAFVGTYHVALAPADAELLVDARPQSIRTGETLRLALGNHELVARAPGYTDLHRRVSVQGGEDGPLELTLTAAPPVAPAAAAVPPPATRTQADQAPAPTAAVSHGRLWTWIASGGAVALGGASTALWLKSKGDADSIRSECRPRVGTSNACREADYDDEAVKALETAHQITLGLALAAGAGAVVLFFVEGNGSARHAAVTLGPGNVSLSGRF